MINEVLPSGEVLHLKNYVKTQAQSGRERDNEAPRKSQSQHNEGESRKENQTISSANYDGEKKTATVKVENDESRVVNKDVRIA